MSTSVDAAKSEIPTQRNKACEACRTLKVRCLPAIEGPSPACQRCLKFSRTCIFAPPQRKRHRKRTDTRIAEMEREIVAMRALLDGSQHKQYAKPESRASVYQSNHGSIASIPGAGVQSSAMGDLGSAQLDLTTFDIVHRGLISHEQAQTLLDTYRNDLVPHFPLVKVPPDQTVESLRNDQPLLFLALMATASSSAQPDLYSTLSTEVIQDYLSRIMVHGQKSLEIVQAILITCAWYFPTDRWSSLKFHEYSHLAATMAIDIGLAERDIPRDEPDTRIVPTASQLDRWRTLLACYIQCTSIALAMRRPTMFQFTGYMADIVRDLEEPALTSPDDTLLCAFIQIFNIGHDINVALSLSDSGFEGLMSDAELQHTVVTYQRKLTDWKSTYRKPATSIDLQIVYHYVRILLHETPLYRYYPPDSFRPPFFMRAPSEYTARFSETSCHSVTQCVAAAQAVLDAFIAQPLAQIRTLPSHIFPRIMFAAIVLINVSLLPVPPEDDDRTALTGFYQDATQVEAYLDAAVDKLVEAAGIMEYRIPTVFAVPMVKARKWYLWARDRRDRGLSIDGGLVFSLFTGPDNHPALTGDMQSVTDPRPIEEPPLADLGVLSTRFHMFDNQASSQNVDPIANIHSNVPLPSTCITGRVEGAESDWMNDLQQDQSTMIDPAIFDVGADYSELFNSIENFSTMDESHVFKGPDSIWALAQADLSANSNLSNDLESAVYARHQSR